MGFISGMVIWRGPQYVLSGLVPEHPQLMNRFIFSWAGRSVTARAAGHPAPANRLHNRNDRRFPADANFKAPMVAFVQYLRKPFIVGDGEGGDASGVSDLKVLGENQAAGFFEHLLSLDS